MAAEPTRRTKVTFLLPHELHFQAFDNSLSSYALSQLSAKPEAWSLRAAQVHEGGACGQHVEAEPLSWRSI